MATFANGSWAANRSMTLSDQFAPLLWADDEAALALQALAQRRGWVAGVTQQVSGQMSLAESAEKCHTRLEPTALLYKESALFLRNAGSALVRVRLEQVEGWLAIVRGGRRVQVLARDTSAQTVRLESVEAAIRYHSERAEIETTERVLDGMAISAERRNAQQKALLYTRLADTRLDACWQLHVASDVSWWKLLNDAKLPTLIGALLLTQAGATGAIFSAAALVGVIATHSTVAWGWIALVLVLLLAAIPLQLLQVWLSKVYNLAVERVVKGRLVYGLLRLLPEETYAIGTGQFLGWNIEGGSLGTIGLAITPLMRALVAFLVTLVVLTYVGGLLAFVTLTGWLLSILAGIWRLSSLRYAYESYHATVTDGVLERMQGHQTRLMQELDWFGDDDQAIAAYVRLKARYQRFDAFFEIWVKKSWLFATVLGLGLQFVQEPTPLLGVGFALILFTRLEIAPLSQSLSDFANAFTAWRLTGIFERAARREREAGNPDVSIANVEESAESQRLLSLQGLGFQYPDSQRLILNNVRLNIRSGERLLLEGPSGGGKSTLALVLTGYYKPRRGLMLLRGLDQETLGIERWRQQAVYVPQFHHNHIIGGTLAFNLLMGRAWPPVPDDLAEAEQVCRELGLGYLLDQMPLGLQQRIGDSGWQLSHGERSRIYIARALLQNSDLIVLDESFASLDPENMAIALRTVLRRARTLLVIAHP